MANSLTAPIASSTQDSLEMADVMNDLLLTKNGTICLIIRTSSVNFDLLSEDEQAAKIESFASLVSSLDFQMQILIETRKINISGYSDYLDSLDVPTLTPGLKRQFAIYKQFVKNLITKKEILDKRFFIIVPFRTGVGISKNTSLEVKQRILEQAVNYLYPKKYHIVRSLRGMGLEGEQLSNSDIIKYFYSIYNPNETINIEGLTVQT